MNINLDNVATAIGSLGIVELEELKEKLASALALVIVSLENKPKVKFFVVPREDAGVESLATLNYDQEDSDEVDRGPR